VTDIYMAEGDGFELIGALKTQGFKIPVVAISGGSKVGAHDPLDIADQLGAAATIAKPFRKQHLIETVKRVIGGDRQETGNGNDADGG
jgi:FixJ family two-component response regulator